MKLNLLNTRILHDSLPYINLKTVYINEYKHNMYHCMKFNNRYYYSKGSELLISKLHNILAEARLDRYGNRLKETR